MKAPRDSGASCRLTGSRTVKRGKYNQLLRQKADTDFLAGFVRGINAELNIESLYSTAARCLYDHFRYNIIVFQSAAEWANSKPKAFASICMSSCRNELVELTRIFKGLCLDDIEGYQSLGLDSSRPGGIFNTCMYMDLPEEMGTIALFWGENSCRKMSDDLLTNVCDCFAAALKNARKFETLKEMSMRDALTGLFNRRVLEEMLVIESERRDPVPMSMVLIDLDDFKKINDTFGHQAGDMVLSGFGDFLRKNCRGAEMVARYGGEEFAIFLSSNPAKEASEVAHRLINNLSGTVFKSMGNQIRLTISIGIANNPGMGRCDAHELMRQADIALYRAKKNGKNQVCIADNRPVSSVINIERKSKVQSNPAIFLAA